MLVRAYRLEARIVALTDLHGGILSALPMIRSRLPWRRRWSSLPFTDTLEPVAVTRAQRDQLLIALAGSVETQPILIRTRGPSPEWYSRQVGTVQVIDLSDGAEGVLRGAKRKTRQNVKLALKAGLTARPITSSSEFLGSSLALLAKSRRRLGAPTQPRRYWAQVWRLHEQNEALTIGVYLANQLVANGVFLIGRNHAVFKYSATDWATRDLRANYLTVATALEHIAAAGVDSMDFGITDLRNASLREHKARWGGEQRPAHFSATDPRLLPETIQPGRVLTQIIQHTPVLVGRTIGSLAYPFVA
jgi:hypothetical protein